MMIAIDRWVGRLALVMALCGGVVLVALVLITVVSVTGRALVPLGLGPVPGDFELVEAGTAFAIFAFLPWCQYNRGHADVELFTMRLSGTFNRFIDLVSDILLLAVSFLISRQHYLGTDSKMQYGETTFILQFPIWWAYMASFIGTAVMVVVAVYCVFRSFNALIQGRSYNEGLSA